MDQDAGVATNAAANATEASLSPRRPLRSTAEASLKLCNASASYRPTPLMLLCSAAEAALRFCCSPATALC